MKPVVVALAGLIVLGCGRSAGGQSAPKGPDVSSQERHHLEHPDLTGPLCKSLKVREEAESWAQLVAKVKPTFTWTAIDEIVPAQDRPAWGGRDMLWVETGADGQPVFRAERAFTWKPAGQMPRWVLLDYHDERPDPGYEEQTMGKPWALQKSVMKARPGGDTASSYVILKGRHDRGGAVYEICWVQMTYAGMGHVTDSRILFVWRDLGGQWRFLGEGPVSIEEKGGGTSVECGLQWQGDPPVPVVMCKVAYCSCEVSDGEGPYLAILRDGIIDPPVEGVAKPFRWLNDQYYMLAEKDDTIDTIAHRLAYWEPGWWGGDKTSASELQRRRERMLLACRERVLQLNPELAKVAAGPIPEGTRVVVTLDKFATSAPATKPGK